MYETIVTVIGRVATDIEHRRVGGGTAVTNFRIAGTERRKDHAGAWQDGDKLFMDVQCWRRLAENAAASLVKGDPVVVTGRLYTRSYEHAGEPRSALTLDAHAVAVDLARCTAVLTRDGRSSGQAEAPAQQGSDTPRAADGSGPELVAAAPGGER